MNKLIILLFSLFISASCFAQTAVDEVALNLPEAVRQPNIYKDYNSENTTKIPVKLKVLKDIKSEFDVYEGQFVEFKVAKDVVYNNKTLIKRGTPVLSRVSVVITSGMNGIPASIIFNDFDIEGINKNRFSDSYEVFGQDRSLLVFPLKWALTPIPPTGSMTNFIKGGHAKLKIKKPITIYYYPEWK